MNQPQEASASRPTESSGQAPKVPKKEKCITERMYILTVILALLAGASVVYLWFEPFVYGSKKILKEHIIVVEGQRDEVLFQRKVLKREMDAYKAAIEELGYSQAVVDFLTKPAEEE